MKKEKLYTTFMFYCIYLYSNDFNYTIELYRKGKKKRNISLVFFFCINIFYSNNYCGYINYLDLVYLDTQKFYKTENRHFIFHCFE